MSENGYINCINCIHYFVTWDNNNPKGCKFFGFKTKMMPSLYVYKSSGNKCGAFQQKQNKSI